MRRSQTHQAYRAYWAHRAPPLATTGPCSGLGHGLAMAWPWPGHGQMESEIHFLFGEGGMVKGKMDSMLVFPFYVGVQAFSTVKFQFPFLEVVGGPGGVRDISLSSWK